MLIDRKNIQALGFALSIALVVALIWAAAAHAQSPAGVQYGEPKAPSGPALGPGGVYVSEDGASAKANAGGGSKAERLPATGGPMLLTYVGALVASGAGLVLLRRSGHGR